MSFDTLNPFSEIADFNNARQDGIGIIFRETNLPLFIPFFENDQVVYKVLTSISAINVCSFSPADSAFSSNKFIKYAYTQAVLDLFQGVSKYNNEMEWQLHLISRLLLLRNRNYSIARPVVAVPEAEIASTQPSLMMCFWGLRTPDESRYYGAPTGYYRMNPYSVLALIDTEIGFSTGLQIEDVVKKTFFGATAVNLDHGHGFLLDYRLKTYSFDFFELLERMTRSVSGACTIYLDVAEVLVLSNDETLTFEVQFNHTFYSEVVSLTCEVEITSTAVTVNYLTLSGETLNGIEFFGVDGFFSNLNYSIDSQTGFGTYSFTINLEVVLMTEACLVVPVSSITVNDYSQYNFINYMTTRYTTETLEEFISTSALAARTLDNVDAEGSLDLYFSPQSRILNTDGFWVFGNMSSVVGTKEPIATTVINSGYEYNTTLYRSESTTHSYDYGMGPSFSIDYSTKYHYHYYVTLNDVVQSSQMSIIQSFYKSHVSALGRDAAIVVYVIDTSYAHNNVYGGATNESFDTVTNLVKSITLRLSIEQDGSISTVEDNNSVVNLASSTSYMLNGYYMSANRQYTYVGQSPIPTFTGLYNFDFCYEYDYQYSEVCDASYLIVGGANFYPYTYKYAPITDPSECVYQSYGTSSLGFSIIKHDDRRTTGTLSSAADVVIAELARGEYTMNSIGEYLGYTFSRMGVGFDPSANIHRDYAAGKLFGKGYALLTENFRQSLYNGVTPYITSRWGSATSYYSYLTEYVVPICNSYTVAGNLGSVINVDTQLLEDYLRYDNPDGLFPRNYSPTGGTCPTFSTDILPLVNFTWLNLYSLSIESTAYRLTNVDSCGTYNVNAVHTWYSVSGILNMYLDNYQNYYPSFYFSSKNMVAIAMDGYRKFGITNSLANIGLISMLTWWRYSYLANTRHYSIVALYRVKNSTIVGIAIGAFRKLKSKDSQYTTLCAATTETAWNAARQAIIDDWVLIHNNNIPQSLIDVMPILCIRSSVVHVFEDFKSQYAFYT